MAFTGTKNFSLAEMKCKDGTLPSDMTTLIKHANHMQTLRDWYCKPMVVNSWYRSKAYNEKLIKQGYKASRNSQHLTGNACDIAMPADIKSATAARKQEWVKHMCAKWHEICGGKGGFGLYDTFIHLDSRSYYVNWDYRSKKTYTAVWK